MALTAAEARVASHTALAEEATERAERADAASASLRSELSGARGRLEAAAAAAEELDSVRSALAASREEAAAAAAALSAAQEEAVRSAQEVGQWRQRAQAWQRRAGLWRRRARSAGGEEAQLGPEPGESEAWFQSVALVALAERDLMALARDEATQRWHELLGSTAAQSSAGQHATASAAEHVSMLRGRSESVWSEAEAWAHAELKRLRTTYPEHFASSDAEEAAEAA